MRKITVDVIASEHFDTAPQGYNQKQVDDFLNEICDYLEFGITQNNDTSKDAEISRLNAELRQMEQKLLASNSSQISRSELDSKDTEIHKLNVEISRLQGLVKNAQHECAEAKAKLELTPKSEIEVSSERSTQLLISAQKLYDSTVTKAEEEAKEIREKAQKEADAQIGSLKEEKENLQRDLSSLKEKFKQYLNTLDQVVEEQKSVIQSSKDKLDKQ